MTYMRARRWWARLLTPWWRCQSKTVAEQHKAGVRHIDIRVRKDKQWQWRLCHGRVDLGRSAYSSLLTLLHEIHALAPDATMRVVLERDSVGNNAASTFVFAIKQYRKATPGVITDVAFKKPWDTYLPDERPAYDHYHKPIDTARPWYKQLGSLLSGLWMTPKRYAAKHPIPDGHRSDGALHYYDFV